jgi:hypothetical protein
VNPFRRRSDVKILAAPPLDQARGTVLPHGKQWIAHCGARAARRYLERSWARTQRYRDPGAAGDPVAVAAYSNRLRDETLARLAAICANEPDPRFAELHLNHVAWLAVDGVRRTQGKSLTWVESIVYLLDRYEAKSDAKER